jgi:hypothetical protein
MHESKLHFLKAVLGEDGANALSKAAARSQELGEALIPRTVLAWLNVASRYGYEGDLPGVTNTYLAFKKSETGFTGSVSVGDELYKFESSSLFHVAGAVLVAMGVSPDAIALNTKDLDIERLGKTIDCLVKARIVTDDLAKAAKPKTGGAGGGGKMPHGPPAAAIPPEAPTPPTPTAPKNKLPGQKAKKPPGPKPPKPIGSNTLGNKPPSASTLKVKKSELQKECRTCGFTQLRKEVPTGCMCFRDLFKSLSSTPTEDGFTFVLDAEWDEDATVTFLETIGRK